MSNEGDDNEYGVPFAADFFISRSLYSGIYGCSR